MMDQFLSLVMPEEQQCQPYELIDNKPHATTVIWAGGRTFGQFCLIQEYTHTHAKAVFVLQLSIVHPQLYFISLYPSLVITMKKEKS
jgi:hypothetical protein